MSEGWRREERMGGEGVECRQLFHELCYAREPRNRARDGGDGGSTLLVHGFLGLRRAKVVKPTRVGYLGLLRPCILIQQPSV